MLQLQVACYDRVVIKGKMILAREGGQRRAKPEAAGSRVAFGENQTPGKEQPLQPSQVMWYLVFVWYQVW
jgi:hypothetical protein